MSITNNLCFSTRSGCKFYGAKGQRYKLFWMGGEEKLDGVGIFVAEKWVDSVVSVETHSKRVLNLRMVLHSLSQFPNLDILLPR